MEEKFTFFWAGPFSQWAISPFTVNGVTYNCAEQFMMASKASIMQDDETLAKIMATESPREQKNLGRLIKNFNADLWDAVKVSVVTQASELKYGQNPDLLKQLLATQGTTLVEASPYDTVWGIGLNASDPKATKRSEWRGENLLGEILTKVRDSYPWGHIGMKPEIKLYTGGYFNFLNPLVDSINIEDIANALAKVCRFGGHVNRFYSVAQHLINCMLNARAMGYSLEVQRAIFLHDAVEAYIGDMVKPLKNLIPVFSAIERNIEMRIGQKFGVDFDKHHDIIKKIDTQMLFAEKREFFVTQEPWTNEPNSVDVLMYSYDAPISVVIKEYIHWYKQLFLFEGQENGTGK